MNINEYQRGKLLAKRMISENREKALSLRERLMKAKIACIQEEVLIHDFWLKEGFLEETENIKTVDPVASRYDFRVLNE